MLLSNKLTTQIRGTDNAMLQVLFTTAVVAAYSALRGELAPELSMSELPAVLLLGVVCTGLASWLYFSPIGELPAQTVAVCGYIEPLSAALLSALVLGERMSAVQLLGAVLVIGGSLLQVLAGTRGEAAAPVPPHRHRFFSPRGR